MERLWTVGEIADYLSVHRLTVKRWIRSGELEAFSLGNAGYRVHNRTLQAFLEARRMTAPAGMSSLVRQHSAA